MGYLKIYEKNIKKYFDIERRGKKRLLLYKKGINKIQIKIPFELNEDVASLAGLMPDGSLIRDLMRIYFHQKKDYSKIMLFKRLLEKLFRPKNKIFIRDNRGTTDIFINSQTLARFFYHILKVPKSDEQMRVPEWVFYSPITIKLAYLKQAFAMEGTILKSLYEIRFITKDHKFALDINKLLKQAEIKSRVKKRIGGTHKTTQYRISIYGKENLIRFINNIGFSTKFHIKRTNALLRKYK